MQKAVKGVFAVDKGSFNKADHAGVHIKVFSQIERMQKDGCEVSLLEYEWVNGYAGIDVDEDADFLYFRRIESSVKLLQTMRKIKKKCKSIKIIMEIPTYPFKGEETEKKSIKRKVSILIGNMFLHRYIDRIVLSGQLDKIKTLYKIPVIHIDNGVDFNNIAVNQNDCNPGDDIHMICVSGCMYSHGYDRMIKGIAEYYQDFQNARNVYLHVVGTGEYLNEYKRIAGESGAPEDKVIFYGRKVGKELDEIYSLCNVAIAHLALHRIGLNQLSSLKSCEYASRGLPMISSASLNIANDETRKYIMYVPEDETPINIEAVIQFYDKVYKDAGVHNDIRNKFMKLCDWEYTFIPVMEYICKNS